VNPGESFLQALLSPLSLYIEDKSIEQAADKSEPGQLVLFGQGDDI
jgi:hypothetical protein